MKFFTRVAVLFYVTLVLFLSCFLLMFIGNLINYENVTDVFYAIYVDNTLKMVTGIVALILLLMNFIFYRLFSINVRGEKIIAFDNPSGRVSVSLVALEDLVKRRVAKLPEIKEVKASITASKKGLNIKSRLAFRSEVNIPEITSRVQEIIKKKIQDTIGIDEPVDVSIYVGKILPEKVKEKHHKEKEEKEERSDSNIPFQGYRA
jgi:uncharacterized alkaline shock family protein YloU